MIRKLTATAAIIAFSVFSAPQTMAASHGHHMSDEMTKCVNNMKAEHGDMHKDGAEHHAEMMAACKKEAAKAHKESGHGKNMEDGMKMKEKMDGGTHY